MDCYIHITSYVVIVVMNVLDLNKPSKVDVQMLNIQMLNILYYSYTIYIYIYIYIYI